MPVARSLVDEVIAQSRRLSALDGYPYHEEGRLEIARALMLVCDSVEAVRKQVDEFIRYGDKCPHPVAIYASASADKADDHGVLQARCEECSDTGWREVAAGRYTAVERCPCTPKPKAEREAKEGGLEAAGSVTVGALR